MGFGLSWPEPMRLAHCGGRPTNLPSLRSKPVCTLCSKLLGAEMMGFFFFLANILRLPLPLVYLLLLLLLLAGQTRGQKE